MALKSSIRRKFVRIIVLDVERNILEALMSWGGHAKSRLLTRAGDVACARLPSPSRRKSGARRRLKSHRAAKAFSPVPALTDSIGD